jgi:hypothetical protein
MRPEWRETARKEWRRIGLRNAAEGAVAGLGAAIAIAATFAYLWRRHICRRPCSDAGSEAP